jgi:hypothetical protein
VLKADPSLILEYSGVYLGLLNSNLDRWEPLSDPMKKRAEGYLTGSKNAINPLHQDIGDRMLIGKEGAFLLVSGVELAMRPETMKIEHALSLMEENDGKVAAVWWRLVVALCFYIRTLPPDSPHRSAWHKTARKPHTLDLTAITETSQICTVGSRYTLTHEQRSELREYARRGGGWELPFHIRIAHARRPPGKGHDPQWPKTVEIPETFVNLVRKPEGAQARGSMAKL